MEKTQFKKEKLDVSMQSNGDPNMRVMRGKALYDAVSVDFKFVENHPRGPRSVEVGRTAHSRFVRRPDGAYTITLRVNAGTKYLAETLIAEVRDIVKAVESDARIMKKLEKEEMKRKEEENGEND